MVAPDRDHHALATPPQALADTKPPFLVKEGGTTNDPQAATNEANSSAHRQSGRVGSPNRLADRGLGHAPLP